MIDWGMKILCMGRPPEVRHDSTAPSPAARAQLMLAFRRSHDQAVEGGRYLDLAGQPAVGFELDGEIQHLLLHVLPRWKLRHPFGVHVDVAGGAGAGAATVR